MTIVISFRMFAAVLGLIGAFFTLKASIKKYKTRQIRLRLVENEEAQIFLRQFNKREVQKALSGYIIPHCSPADPTNRDGEEYLADTREPVFEYIDRNIESVERSYHLLLADTGMGKTTFCLNYYAHCKKKFPDTNICLVSLASSECTKAIRSVTNKANTILIADALDEFSSDPAKGRQGLTSLLEISADYKLVIITCRSQFFLADDAIPRETTLPILVPRSLGQSPTFSLVRSFISPFSETERDKYIAQHFPLYKFWQIPTRRRAQELANAIPDLAHRPMLLERLPELALDKAKSTEIFDLYNLLVEGWLKRESRWINFSLLKAVTNELAIYMYERIDLKGGRHTPDEIEFVAVSKFGENPNWAHLTSRSLLNRDSQGNFKFAHKSILEFLVVKLACDGDDRPLHFMWTPFMKEMFISWGHTTSGRGDWELARSILESKGGRTNIAPLFDLQGISAVRGLPNFKRITERRFTPNGERVAPASWRSSSIEVSGDSDFEYAISDSEYNLTWKYLPNKIDTAQFVPLRLLDVLNLIQSNAAYSLPSFEQFTALLEGLQKSNNMLLEPGVLFLLEDKPAKNQYLLVEIYNGTNGRQNLDLVDQKRRVSGTNIYLNSYLARYSKTSSAIETTIVGQLYVVRDDVYLN